MLLSTELPGREFSLRIGLDGPPFVANSARPWYAFGDAGSFSTPGGHVRIVGDAVGIGNSSSVSRALLHVIVKPGQVLTLPARANPAGVNGTKADALARVLRSAGGAFGGQLPAGGVQLRRLPGHSALHFHAPGRALPLHY